MGRELLLRLAKFGRGSAGGGFRSKKQQKTRLFLRIWKDTASANQRTNTYPTPGRVILAYGSTQGGVIETVAC